MSITTRLLVDLIVVAFICGTYLQYKGFKALTVVPTREDRKDRRLKREEIMKLVESASYVFMGAWFEVLSLSQAIAT